MPIPASCSIRRRMSAGLPRSRPRASTRDFLRAKPEPPDGKAFGRPAFEANARPKSSETRKRSSQLRVGLAKLAAGRASDRRADHRRASLGGRQGVRQTADPGQAALAPASLRFAARDLRWFGGAMVAGLAQGTDARGRE